VGSYFLDSSGLVKRYIAERGTAWIRGLTDRAARNDLILARVTEVEVVAALMRRSPPLPASDLALAIARFQEDCRQRRFRFVAANGALISQASALAITRRLRGYDAIQLAAAVEARRRNDARGLPSPILISADIDLHTAAAAEGFVVDNPNSHP
jgi:predicted nucleic acid-binding protein